MCKKIYYLKLSLTSIPDFIFYNFFSVVATGLNGRPLVSQIRYDIAKGVQSTVLEFFAIKRTEKIFVEAATILKPQS